MHNRPVSVTLIAWVLIATGAISLITCVISLNNPMVKELMSQGPMPMVFQCAIMYMGVIVAFVSGIAMLKGQNWARFLYVIWSIIGFVTGMTTSPMKAVMIPGLVIFLVIVFFLFRPKANEYFKRI